MVKGGILRSDMPPFASRRVDFALTGCVLVCFFAAFYCHNVTVWLILLKVYVLRRDGSMGATVTTVTCVTVVTVRLILMSRRNVLSASRLCRIVTL